MHGALARINLCFSVSAVSGCVLLDKKPLQYFTTVQTECKCFICYYITLIFRENYVEALIEPLGGGKYSTINKTPRRRGETKRLDYLCSVRLSVSVIYTFYSMTKERERC